MLSLASRRIGSPIVAVFELYVDGFSVKAGGVVDVVAQKPQATSCFILGFLIKR